MRFDVFNGDADGLCALQQLRLAQPAEARLVTGVKRDIALLARVHCAPGDQVTVLDVSLQENRADLLRVLAEGAAVTYFDHHMPGEIPRHERLQVTVDTAPDVCTSLLVDRHLGGAHRVWAVAAAFGDNLEAAARRAAQALRVSAAELEELATLGTLLNYNAYGDTLADLHFDPAELHRAMAGQADALRFFRQAPQMKELQRGYAADLAHAEGLAPAVDSPLAWAFRLPGEPWARRVQGVFANRLALQAPHKATALLVENPDGTLRVSVRAPLQRPQGADAVCRPFAGGGRAGAAGINALPPAELPRFLDAFARAFGAPR